MATWLGWLGKAFAQVTRLMTSNGEAIAGAISFGVSHGEGLVHWLHRYWTSTCETLRHWLKISTDDVVVVAEMEVENLGTERVPIILPKICTKHDLLLFDCIGQ